MSVTLGGWTPGEWARLESSENNLCWSASYGLRLLRPPYGPRPLLRRPVSRSCLFGTFVLVGLVSAPQLPDAVGHGGQHGYARCGNTRTGSCAGQRQHVCENQHRAQANGRKAKQNGASRRNTAGGRLMR